MCVRLFAALESHPWCFLLAGGAPSLKKPRTVMASPALGTALACTALRNAAWGSAPCSYVGTSCVPHLPSSAAGVSPRQAAQSSSLQGFCSLQLCRSAWCQRRGEHQQPSPCLAWVCEGLGVQQVNRNGCLRHKSCARRRTKCSEPSRQQPACGTFPAGAIAVFHLMAAIFGSRAAASRFLRQINWGSCFALMRLLLL